MKTMTTHQTYADLPTISRAEINQIVRDAQRMRAEKQAELIRAAGRGIARLSRALTQPIVAAVTATETFKQIEFALARHREYSRVRAELETYSDRELTADLRLNRSDIAAIATEAANELRPQSVWARQRGTVAAHA